MAIFKELTFFSFHGIYLVLPCWHKGPEVPGPAGSLSGNKSFLYWGHEGTESSGSLCWAEDSNGVINCWHPLRNRDKATSE